MEQVNHYLVASLACALFAILVLICLAWYYWQESKTLEETMADLIDKLANKTVENISIKEENEKLKEEEKGTIEALIELGRSNHELQLLIAEHKAKIEALIPKKTIRLAPEKLLDTVKHSNAVINIQTVAEVN